MAAPPTKEPQQQEDLSQDTAPETDKKLNNDQDDDSSSEEEEEAPPPPPRKSTKSKKQKTERRKRQRRFEMDGDMDNMQMSQNNQNMQQQQQQQQQQPQKQSGGGGGGGGGDTLSLHLELNLEIEIELKARIHGDLTLTLLHNQETPNRAPLTTTNHFQTSHHSKPLILENISPLNIYQPGKMTKPAFATPLPQSSRSETLEWRFPKPHNQYVLTGKSRAAWHTSFVIPQLNLLLDAGLCVNKSRPKHVFLTHGHSDHTLLAPAFVKREDPPDVFCPAEMVKVLDDFLLSRTMLNLGGLITVDDAEQLGADTSDEGTGDANGDKSICGREWLNTHITHGLKHGDTVPLRRTNNVTATAFDCDHTVPCLGFYFSLVSNRLRPEYTSQTGPQLKALRQSGVEITATHSTPMFAFLGDTTAATLAAEPDWLKQGIPVVITECSFLYQEHKPQAVRTKHTSWSDLELVIRKWPRTTFVLTHFSMRYNDKAIRDFFLEMEDAPTNIVVWVDGEDDL
ncbi:hypothetical protein FZEAL_10147 [Fusarium zealandicum]|uniref:Metallo-beta-lactamase domain-containing protein n=1 Tax=Fusarium zealandicum TaxID=1053134 RepID=A0A8H4U5D7_9HYPO|nr:hypothetical protein FZEAL_10147 [Fusarium zealandicum]